MRKDDDRAEKAVHVLYAGSPTPRAMVLKHVQTSGWVRLGSGQGRVVGRLAWPVPPCWARWVRFFSG